MAKGQGKLARVLTIQHPNAAKGLLQRWRRSRFGVRKLAFALLGASASESVMRKLKSLFSGLRLSLLVGQLVLPAKRKQVSTLGRL
jgi:hypothetical protein